MFKKIFFILMLQCQVWAVSNSKPFVKPQKYDLAICAIFQDEAPYMKEWIEFHKLVGVQHFYLYNNLSTDNYLEILQPYIESGEVELVEWNYDFVDVKDWRILQPKAYEHALNLARDNVTWLAIIDLDEFLFPIQGNLISFLKNYTQFGGVIVNWQVYGTSHVPFIPENTLMIEKLVMKGPTNYQPNTNYKSIVQPTLVEGCRNPHSCLYKKGYFHVNANKTKETPELPFGIHVDKIRINHYWSRDEHYFFDIKLPRQVRRDANAKKWVDYEKTLNEVTDTSILKFVPILRKQMNFVE